MHVAIVDIGSNSTRLLVAEVAHGRVIRELERHSRVTRLGSGVDASGRLQPEAKERVYDVLGDYTEIIERHGASAQARAVLTSAVRDAANGAGFARAVAQRFRLTPRVLSGDEEAALTFRGATSERDPADTTPILVIDIGGGSTELVIGTGHEMSFHVSTQAGVVRQSDRHIQADPPTQAELAELRQDVHTILEAAVPETQRRRVSHAIAVAGTATSLGAIAQELDPYDPAKVHGYRMGAAARDAIRDTLVPMTLAQRREVRGLHPDRASTIIPGVLILECVMELFQLAELEISEHDILRGAALALDELGPAKS